MSGPKFKYDIIEGFEGCGGLTAGETKDIEPGPGDISIETIIEGWN